MTTDTPDAEEPRKGFDELLRTTEELDTPDGFKAEAHQGEVGLRLHA
jgi:hypothetical protein